VQIVQGGGQPTFFPEEYTPPAWIAPVMDATPIHPQSTNGLLTSLILPIEAGKSGAESAPRASFKALAGNVLVAIKPGVPRVFKTELLPLSTDQLVNCVGASVAIDDRVLNAGMRRNIQVTRQLIEIFRGDEEVEQIQARLSDAEIARRAQGVLFDAQYVDPRDLYAVLMKRLEGEYSHRGMEVDEATLIHAFNLIMATFPNLIKRASRQCAAQYREVLDTDALPKKIEMPPGARKSRLNVYGVMPQDMNSHETAFVELLDADVSGTVEWWFRNEPRKSWSVGIVMPSGDRYYPDFAVKVKDRTLGNGILLVEIKGNHILNGDDTLDKAIAEHKIYRRPLMLLRESDGRFMTVRYNERTDKNEANQIFRVENLAQY
jgi:type III restriction enzyme